MIYSLTQFTLQSQRKSFHNLLFDFFSIYIIDGFLIKLKIFILLYKNKRLFYK